MLTDVLETGAEVAAQLGKSALFLRQDVANEDEWCALVETALARFGKIDVLINNAGIFRPNPIRNTSAADFDRHYLVNQRGTFLGMKAVVETMKAGGGGSIVNISSLAGLRGYPDMIAYCSTKWAIRGMTKSAALELAPFRIPVNSAPPRPCRYSDDEGGPFGRRARAICIGRSARSHGLIRRRRRTRHVPGLGHVELCHWRRGHGGWRPGPVDAWIALFESDPFQMAQSAAVPLA